MVLYGFSSKAPLGRYDGPVREVFQSAPAGEMASGRPSATLLNLFGPVSMVAVPGLSDAEPHASFRGDARMFLDHLEHYVSSLGAAERALPEAALARVRADGAARERSLALARDADRAPVQMRMLALAQRRVRPLRPSRTAPAWC